MPKKYHIHTETAPNRHRMPGRASLIDWEEGCLRCAVCVKKKCVYGVYQNRRIDPVSLADTADMLCKHCFSCVQNCPNRLISKSVNPEYELLGDDYWTPSILSTLNYQAETGKIPVSGAGYSGPFSGPGFDAIWTDMSEIVRPTRDGIHGREYISTLTDIGRKPPFLAFDPDGRLVGAGSNHLDIPLPMILSLPASLRLGPSLIRATAAAARELGTFLRMPARLAEDMPDLDPAHVMPCFDRASLAQGRPRPRDFRLIEVEDFDGIEDWLAEFRRFAPKTVATVRVAMDSCFLDRLAALTEVGAPAVHLATDSHGLSPAEDGGSETFIADLLRQAHLRLIEMGRRDEITLLAGGGIALAEHVAKAIICGADVLCVDTALWAGLECRVCSDCGSRPVCPALLETAPEAWVVQRLLNLVGAWHNQLLEVMGAMGMREIRRLRGEVGRAMFFEDLERDSFGPIFGRRKERQA